MRAAWIMLAACATLAGCNNAMFDDGPRAEVRKSLKGSDSVLFRERAAVENWVCISYNIQNTHRGYTGVKSDILLESSPGNWYIKRSNSAICNIAVLNRVISLEKQEKQALADVLAEMKKRKFIAPDVDVDSVSLGIKNRCTTALAHVMTSYRIAYSDIPDFERASWLERGKADLDAVSPAICHL